MGAERGARELAIAECVAVRNAACVHRTPYPGAGSHFSDSHAANTNNDFMKIQVIPRGAGISWIRVRVHMCLRKLLLLFDS